jgi:tetratricopeptide (TPR) repeat protein
MGTPTYMAPEQHSGQELDARADQYAFCIALYRALYGERPFSGDYDALVDQKMRGLIAPPPTGSKVPTWLHEVVVRGLGPRRSTRWPDMDALLVALDPSRRRRRATLALGLGGLATLGAAVAWPATKSADAACETAAAPIENIWNETRRAEIRQAFAASETPFALPTFDRAATWIDGYASRWSTLAVASCQRQAEGSADAGLEDRRRTCLRQRRSELGALVDRLAGADRQVIETAVKKANALTPLTLCEDDEQLLASVAPPSPQIAAKVDTLRDELAALAEMTPVDDPVLERAKTAVEDARATGYEPLVAEALLRYGECLRRSGRDYQASAEPLTESFHVASASGHDRVALQAANRLTFLYGFHAQQFAEAETWVQHGEAVLQRTGNRPLDEALIRTGIASLYQERGPYDKALEQWERVREIQEQVQGVETDSYANVLNGIGDALRRLDRLDESRAYLEKSIATYEGIYGKNHPAIFTPLGNLSVVVRLQGDSRAAEPLLARTVEMAKKIFGPEHPNVGMALGNYANLFWERGEYEKCYEINTQVIEILEKSLGRDHPAYAMALDNAAGALVSLERYDEAEPLVVRALDIRERQLGDTHPEVARSLSAVGRIANERDQHDKAEKAFRRAMKIMEETVGLEHKDALPLRNGLAAALAGQGRSTEARKMYEELAAICDRNELDNEPCNSARAEL